MPAAASRRQYRMMMAILHGKKVDQGDRGRPPKSVAAKYSSPGDSAPESKHNDKGGTWGEKHHAAAKEKSKKERTERKKKKSLSKAYEDFIKSSGSKGTGIIVLDDSGRILMGKDKDGNWSTPGGGVEPGETYEQAAMRELKEESGLVGHAPKELLHGDRDATFIVESFRGKPTASDELKNFKWFEPHSIPWGSIRGCSEKSLKYYVENKLGKSLKDLLAKENLQKNIIRQKPDVVYEITHGDALRLVGNGMFRRLRDAVKGMENEDFKDFHIDTYIVSIRKHLNDVYSGRISDGHKIIHQFVNRSLPQLTAELMSVFEWYLPEDEADLELLDEAVLSDDAIHGGINQLVDNYKKHNIKNIYTEMESIREQIRNGMAVDLQQVEQKMMKLFDKLEETVHEIAGKHNKLGQDAGKEIDEIETKLRELQSKIEQLENRPQTVEAYSPVPHKSESVLDNFYPYLSRPTIEIMPNGKMKISFNPDWQHLEKENFLKDMKAKIIKKAEK